MTITTIYYLQWHASDGPTQEDASDLFHRFHIDPPDTLTETDFDDLYREVATTDTDDLKQLFAEWNHGSGWESAQFQNLQYCERCYNYIDGVEEAVTHAAQNHGYDPFHDSSDPAYIHEARSLSVGDIAILEDEYYACAPIGWQELKLIEEGDT